MSGALESYGLISNWAEVHAHLFEKEEEENDWRWDDDAAEVEGSSKDEVTSPSGKNGKTWVQDCVLGVSPVGDVMVICRNERAVFLTSEWDSRASQMKYSTQYKGNLSNEGETITSCLVIPLVSNKKSSPGVPDWTCIVVGFSDGNVRMYTENGTLLIAQMFHDQPVTGIKCHSYKPAATQQEHDQLEEVFILYETVLVTIDGFGLFQTLRGCRNRIARVQANAAESIVDPPPLSYKKWQYESQGVEDCESVGVQTPCRFDHLVSASVLGGVVARPNKIPHTSTVFATVGSKPYVSYHYAKEGQAPFMIGKLAYSVANKLTSGLLNAASGWLGFGSGNSKSSGQNQKPEKPKIEPATQMDARFGLPDKSRNGRSIVISPCHKLSAITDTLGRVVLLDNERGIAVRMWKGYRDAQCAWLQVSDDMNSKTKASGRKALFLVIYAPRKGQVEVFTMQQGPKVASFPVSKSGSLIGMPFGMMGLNNVPLRGVKNQMLPCLFVDPDGQLHHLQIPFHLSLTDTNNSKLKDMHLLKTLQRLLRDSPCTSEDINVVLHDIKTQAMINQAFKILIQYCKQYDLMSSVIETFLEKFCENERYDFTVPFKIQNLLHLYSYLVKTMNAPPAYSKEENSSGDNTVLLCLHATEKEIKLVKDMANKEVFNKSSSKGVSFADDNSPLNVADFLSLFQIEYDPAKIKHAAASTSNQLHLNQKDDRISQLGALLLCGCFNSDSNLERWKTCLRNCDIAPLELLQEVLRFWSNKALVSSSFIDMMHRLYLVVRAVCDLEGNTNTLNEKSPFWESIRHQISKGHKTFYNYTFAIVCRAVTIDLHQEEDKTNDRIKKKNAEADSSNPTCANESGESSSNMDVELDDTPDDETWENVSLDLIRWNILLKQLEDLSFLTTILTQKPSLSKAPLPTLPFPINLTELSVVSLLEKGPGCIAEMVGSWLTTIGIDPSLLVENSEIPVVETVVTPEYTVKELRQLHKNEPKETKKEVDEETVLEDATSVGSQINCILELLKCLKENFPVSLNSTIILSNYCWEYCLAWNREVERVNYFQAAIKCAARIPSNFVKQGLMFMMWTTFISQQIANIVSRGKIRKEKLLEKTNVISGAESRISFLHACVKFLDDFMDNNVMCQGVVPPKKPSKKTHWSVDSVSTSVTDLALNQPLANYEMILLHYQLALSSLFVYNFGIRKASMRPMNLFDTKASMMLFTSISTPAPYSNVEVDLALKVLREDFLCLVITNITAKLPEDLDISSKDTDDEEDYIAPSLEGVKEYENWTLKCFELGRIWGLDLDTLRINQVCELYSSGFDLLAMESIGAVAAKDILGSKILSLAGMRLHYYVQSNRDSTTEIVASMSTNLSTWLNKLDYSKLRCLRFPKRSITELAQQTVRLIPEASYDHKLADDLLVCSSFINE